MNFDDVPTETIRNTLRNCFLQHAQDADPWEIGDIDFCRALSDELIRRAIDEQGQ